MSLVKAQCTNCGGTLEVDNSKEAAVCPYCNTPYIVEKAINYYVTNNISVNGDSVEKMISDAETMHNVLNDRKNAEEKYKEICKKYPADYRGHFGLGDVLSNKRTTFSTEALRSYENALSTAPDEMKSKLQDLCYFYNEGLQISNKIKQAYAQLTRKKAESITPTKKVLILINAILFSLLGVILIFSSKSVLGGILLMAFGCILFFALYLFNKDKNAVAAIETQIDSLYAKMNEIIKKLSQIQ